MTFCFDSPCISPWTLCLSSSMVCAKVSSSRWSFSSSPAATTNGSSLEVSLFSLSLDELEVREGGDPEMGCLKDGGVHYTENTDYITIHIQSLDGSSENKAHQCTLWAISVAKIQQKCFDLEKKNIDIFSNLMA